MPLRQKSKIDTITRVLAGTIGGCACLYLLSHPSIAAESLEPAKSPTSKTTQPIQAPKKSVFSVMGDLTYASKYITDGFDVGTGKPVIEPSVSIKLFTEGFSVLLWSALQMDRTQSAYDEVDVFARYNRNLFEGSWLALNVHGFIDYWFYPKNLQGQDSGGAPVSLPSRKGNKLSAGVSLPRALPIWGAYLVPAYNAYYWLYWKDNRKDLFQGGARHEAMLDYTRKIPSFIPGATTQYLGVTGTLNYHDGAFGVNPGLSHSTAQLTALVYAGDNLLFSGTVNRQWAFKTSDDISNQFWSTLSVTKTF